MNRFNRNISYGTSKDLVCKKEECKCIIIIKMINYDDVAKENIKNHNTNWQQISVYHPYRILIVGGSGFGKTDALFDLIKIQK